MHVGDLVRLPQNEGYAIVYEVDHSKPGAEHHPYSTAVVIRAWGLDYWDADACEVISEAQEQIQGPGLR